MAAGGRCGYLHGASVFGTYRTVPCRVVSCRVVSYPTRSIGRSIGPVRSRLSVSMHRDAGIDESTPA